RSRALPEGLEVRDADGQVLAIDFTSLPGWSTLVCTQRRPGAHVRCKTADRDFTWDAATRPDRTGGIPLRLRIARLGIPLLEMTPPLTVTLHDANAIDLAGTPPGCEQLSGGTLRCR